MVNPLWAWNALRGRSITFATLCTLTLTGCSVYGWVRNAATWLGAPWWMLWIIPPALAAIISSREADWVPDMARRSRIALSILALGILFFITTLFFFGAPDTHSRGSKSVPADEIR